MTRLLIALCTLLWAAATACGQTRDPRLPPGTDPGGPAIAVISAGIDYTDPQVSRLLARDGEGDLIGWDFVDSDNRPFDATKGAAPVAYGGSLTELVRKFPNMRARIVPVRVDPANAGHLAAALAFIARTPARTVVVPLWSRSREHWQPFGQAARQFRDLLLIMAAGDEGLDLDTEPVWPAALRLDNAVVVNFAIRDAGRIEPAGNRSARLVDISVARFPADPQVLVESLPGDADMTGSPVTNTREAAVLIAVACGRAPAPSSQAAKAEILRYTTPHSFGGSRAIYRNRIC